MKQLKSASRGFTLVEVLVTMLLLAIVLPVTMRGLSVALAAGANARRTSDAALLAESKLNEIVVTRAWSTGGSVGDYGTGYPGFQWSLQSATRDFGLIELSLVTTWTEQGKSKSLTLTTLVSDATGGTTTP